MSAVLDRSELEALLEQTAAATPDEVVRRTTCPDPGSVATSMPATVASPDVLVTRVVRTPTVVVLPAPFGPSSPKTSPRRTAKLSPSTAGVPLRP